MFYPIRCKHEWNGESYENNGMPEIGHINPQEMSLVMIGREVVFTCHGKEWLVHPDDVEKFKAMVEQNLAPGWNECEQE